jgi:hypothetical protein
MAYGCIKIKFKICIEVDNEKIEMIVTFGNFSSVDPPCNRTVTGGRGAAMIEEHVYLLCVVT